MRVKNDWDAWIIYMLDSVEQTAKSTMALIKPIKKLIEKEIERVKKKCAKIYSRELVECLFKQPYCRILALEKTLGITRFTASKYLKELEKIGLLKGEKVGRDMLYINKPLFVLL